MRHGLCPMSSRAAFSFAHVHPKEHTDTPADCGARSQNQNGLNRGPWQAPVFHPQSNISFAGTPVVRLLRWLHGSNGTHRKAASRTDKSAEKSEGRISVRVFAS